ncbi:MAG: hypothetical protein GWP17_03910 [Aquificales bacterium]|nr:hypothetical protein [Aquificales bacterium]
MIKDGLKTAVRLGGSFVAACGLSFGLSFGLLFLLLTSLIGAEESQQNLDDFGYGFNVDVWNVAKLQEMGFNWMKVFDGPGSRFPVNMFMRVKANASHYNNLSAFGDSMAQLAQSQKGYIDAYEIGNEPNLDASYGWTVSPNAAHYTAVLCEAYHRIKAVDPDAVVVSAGLAPTGRVQGNWDGHAGHNGLYQDEREFFKEFLAAGGGDCLDAVGYHPYGYSADYDAVPDVGSVDPDQNCTNGFCFRGVEKIYEIMVAEGYGDRMVWATEFGWIVEPPAHCLADGSWEGREWQIVTEAEQAANLAGAFEYATSNWPWMEAMFIFNLNFNFRSDLGECEQMRFYAIQDRPAEAALRDIPKVVTPKVGKLEAQGAQLTAVITSGQQPITVVSPIYVRNVGTAPFTFTMAAEPMAEIVPVILTPTAVITPDVVVTSQVTFGSNGRSPGIYTGTLIITTTEMVEGAPLNLPVSLFIFDEIHITYLPIIQKSD